MMAGLPQFAVDTGGAVASYDWLDYTSGSGYRTFYGLKTGTTSYSFVTRTIDASTEYSVFGEVYPDVEGDFEDIDIDITMAAPSIMNGTAFVAFTHSIADAGGGMTHRSFKVTLYHVSGVTETDIGGGQVTTTDRTTSTDAWRELIPFTVTNRKFCIGEKIRVNIVCRGQKAGGVTALRLWFDPASLSTKTDFYSRTIGTDFTLDAPFKIDI